jgi:hypothetical protein
MNSRLESVLDQQHGSQEMREIYLTPARRYQFCRTHHTPVESAHYCASNTRLLQIMCVKMKRSAILQGQDEECNISTAGSGFDEGLRGRMHLDNYGTIST